MTVVVSGVAYAAVTPRRSRGARILLMVSLFTTR